MRAFMVVNHALALVKMEEDANGKNLSLDFV